MDRQYTQKFLDRFWSYVDRQNDQAVCWNWIGAALNRGYGKISHNKKTRAAHRVSFEIAYGTIPVGLFVLHKCDNPLCVNPFHLFLGTQLDNMHDRNKKGRANLQRGEDHYACKYSDELIAYIRSRVASGLVSQSELASETNVPQYYISRLVNYKRRSA